MAGPSTQRYEWVARKRAINDAMMPFVRQHSSHALMMGQYQTIEKIVDGCWRLGRDDDAWVPEFAPGTDVKEACAIAFLLHCFTKIPVRFSFNGVAISFVDRDFETKGRA